MAILIAASACTEDVFLTDLNRTRVSIRDTSTTQIVFKSYQIPPSIGGHPTLYLGKKGDFILPFSLLRLGDLQLFSDTLIVIDSAYVQVTVDSVKSDTSLPELELTLGYFDFDSSFSESEGHYRNIDWVPESYPFFSSTSAWDTSGSVQHIRFSVDPLLVKTWSDTASSEPLFILKTAGNLESMTAFHSSESSPEFVPMLKVFFHQDTVSIDTNVVFVEDLTIVIPPDITGGVFDTTKAYVGVAAGLRSLILPEIGDLQIPASAVILKGNLVLPVDKDRSSLTSTSGTVFQLFSLKDSVENWQWGESLEEDTYDLHSDPVTFSFRASISDSTLTLDISDIIQSLVINKALNDAPFRNFGVKLLAIISPSLFDYVAFHSREDGHPGPILEILYEIP